MLRAVAILVQALAISGPSFQPRHAAAEHIQALAVRYRFDPLTLVAVVQGESGWNPYARNPRSGALGLGQILPQYGGTTDWRLGLTRSARMFERWREYCRERVGTAQASAWLQGYQGLDAVRGTTCGHRRARHGWVAARVPGLTKRVLARRAELERKVSR